MPHAIDPELQPLLELLPPVELGELSELPAARAAFAAATAALLAEIDASGVLWEARQVPGPAGAPPVAVRLYRPERLPAPAPALLYIHGGGFVLGDLDSEHGVCVNLCRSLGIVLVSVDYRLSPETPFPGPLEDCYAALQWLAGRAPELQVDPGRLAIAGQSAGGCLAAATALLARDRGGPPLCFQYLSIPVLDDRLDTTSMAQFTDTPIWDRGKAEASWRFYLGEGMAPGSEAVPALAAPARAEDLSGLPPAYVSTMEFDPLRDEGLLYGLRLLQAGVQTELHNYPGTFHGSSLFAHTRIHQRELADTLAVLRRALALET
jgi:acetyl esterase